MNKTDYKDDEINSIATFHTLEKKPDSNCWLKEKEWAWKDGKIIK